MKIKVEIIFETNLDSLKLQECLNDAIFNMVDNIDRSIILTVIDLSAKEIIDEDEM